MMGRPPRARPHCFPAKLDLRPSRRCLRSSWLIQCEVF
jgi:hypothetical protein